MGKQQTKQTCFDQKAEIEKVEKVLLSDAGAEKKLIALARGIWIKKHGTSPPKTMMPDFVKLEKWHNGRLIEAANRNENEALNFLTSYGWSATKLAFKESDKKWVEHRKSGGKNPHPFSRRVRAWMNRPRSIETASTTQTNGMVRIPYRISEHQRREWRPFDGDVNAVIVDGEPLAARITGMPAPTRSGRARVYVSKGQGQLSLAISHGRTPDSRPLVLVAFEKFSDDLRNPIATDVAILMAVAHVSNQNIRTTSADGARALARGRDGKVRSRIRDTDKQRFEDAFGALHGMSEWVYCPDKIWRLFPLIKSDRINNDVVEFGPPAWAKNEHGFYTLSGGFGQASTARLVGQANDGGLWRTVAGVEYWLARGPAVWSKKKGKVDGPAKTLLPTSKGGPGGWQKLGWRRLLNLSGDVWDECDKREEAKARKRYERRAARLKNAKYFTPSLGSRPALAGDTVEFHKSDRGYIHVRATDRFVEAARLADEKQFETVRLADFMGI